jgi:hypothetical protein
MHEMIELHHYFDVSHDWASHHRALICFVATATMIAIVVVGIAQSSAMQTQSSLVHQDRAESTMANRARELPAEWRWEGRETFRSEQMYRKNGAAYGEIDWIRTPGRRTR